jgi:nuclear migration protein JNM1
VENAHNKTRQLIKDAERLERLRAANDDGATSPTPTGALINGHGSHIDMPEKASKINALYGTLATIDTLSPTLPMVLERLRTLRALHTSAVTASTALDDIEKRQAEQAAEIGQWREALQKVESYVKDGQSSLKENVEEVDTWVRELEDRLARFS